MNGLSPEKSVTVLSVGANPRSTWSGSHGDASSCSPMQYVERPGWPMVDIEIWPARVPPRLIMISRNARPIVALAR